MIAADHGGNSGDSAHADAHSGTYCHYQIFRQVFCSQKKVAKEGLPKPDPSGLGAGGPRFKSGRPDH
jgi:hypothetical protein